MLCGWHENGGERNRRAGRSVFFNKRVSASNTISWWRRSCKAVTHRLLFVDTASFRVDDLASFLTGSQDFCHANSTEGCVIPGTITICSPLKIAYVLSYDHEVVFAISAMQKLRHGEAQGLLCLY